MPIFAGSSGARSGSRTLSRMRFTSATTSSENLPSDTVVVSAWISAARSSGRSLRTGRDAPANRPMKTGALRQRSGQLHAHGIVVGEEPRLREPGTFPRQAGPMQASTASHDVDRAQHALHEIRACRNLVGIDEELHRRRDPASLQDGRQRADVAFGVLAPIADEECAPTPSSCPSSSRRRISTLRFTLRTIVALCRHVHLHRILPLIAEQHLVTAGAARARSTRRRRGAGSRESCRRCGR